MNQLKEVTFINSATLPFAQIDVADNTLFSGGNGAGKTTILRSILYFYGAGRSEHLGISRKKKRFEEYYFASTNSYLIYRFENAQADVLAIVYKAGGLRVKYRFAIERNKEDIKELFFDGNSALEPKALWSRLLEKEYELSPVLNSPKEYRSVLYGQDRKLQQFAFFNANTEYDQIPKTLSNVFINSKLDSGSIKKSLVSSISGFEPIDLNQMRRHINDFRVKYDDISSFEKNSTYINEAVSTLGDYEGQTEELHRAASSLGANAKVVEEALESVKVKVLGFKDELAGLKESYERDESEYVLKHESELKDQGALEREITEAELKREEYEKADIASRLAQWEKKPLLEDELLALQAQLSKLSDDQGSLNERFDAMRQREMKSFHDKAQRVRSDITTIAETYNRDNAALLEEEQRRLTEHRAKVDEVLQTLSEKRSEAKEAFLNAQNQERIVQNRSYDKEKIDLARSELHKANTLFSEEKAKVELLQSQAEKIAERIYSAEQAKGFNLQSLNHDFDKETQALKSEIEELRRRKNRNSASLLGFMRENSFKEVATLSAILRDEVLHAQDLKPSITDGDGTVLGLKIDTSAIDTSAYEEGSVSIMLQACEERLKKMNAQHSFKQDEVENETRNAINALRREQGSINTQIDESLRHIPKLEQNALQQAEGLESLENMASEKKILALEEAKTLTQEKERLFQVQVQEYEQHSKVFQDELELITSDIKRRHEKLVEEKETQLSVKKSELDTIEQAYEQKLDQIKAEEDATLVKGGVDPSLLQKYQNEIEEKKRELSNIEAFSELISEYKIDQKRIFAHLDEKKKRLTSLTESIKADESKHLTVKEEYEKNRTEVEQRRDTLLAEVNSLQKDLKEFVSFKESALYTQLSSYIQESQGEESKESLSDIINRLRDLGFEHASSKDRLRKKLNRAFSAISLHNIFNLYAPSSDSDRAI